jgi:hypothetical protein
MYVVVLGGIVVNVLAVDPEFAGSNPAEGNSFYGRYLRQFLLLCY